MKRRKISIIAILLVFILALGITGCKNDAENNVEKEKEFMSASWAYNYADIEEISQASDVIALVQVDSIVESSETTSVPYTEYQMNVIEGVYNMSDGDNFVVVMTGVETDDKIIEIEDDPLMNIGDEYLVFCKENTDGTYRIISGSQGRLAYEDGKLNSLNVIDEQVSNANAFSAIMVENEDAQKLIAEIQTYVEVE